MLAAKALAQIRFIILSWQRKQYFQLRAQVREIPKPSNSFAFGSSCRRRSEKCVKLMLKPARRHAGRTSEPSGVKRRAFMCYVGV